MWITLEKEMQIPLYIKKSFSERFRLCLSGFGIGSKADFNQISSTYKTSLAIFLCNSIYFCKFSNSFLALNITNIGEVEKLGVVFP